MAEELRDVEDEAKLVVLKVNSRKTKIDENQHERPKLIAGKQR
jgi:hypothetical protein